MKLIEITTILGQAAVVFPNLTLNEVIFKAWHQLFEDEDPKQFQAALTALVKEPKRVFFPTPGEVVGMIQKLGLAEPSIAELWDEALGMARAGFDLRAMTGLMEKRSPRAARALRSIGWDRVRFSNAITELGFARRDFESAMREMGAHEQEQTTRMEALSVLQKIAGSVGGATRGRLGGLQEVVGDLPSHTATRSDGDVHKDAAQQRRAIPENGSFAGVLRKDKLDLVKVNA